MENVIIVVFRPRDWGQQRPQYRVQRIAAEGSLVSQQERPLDCLSRSSYGTIPKIYDIDHRTLEGGQVVLEGVHSRENFGKDRR
jgi:hypothetical protein